MKTRDRTTYFTSHRSSGFHSSGFNWDSDPTSIAMQSGSSFSRNDDSSSILTNGFASSSSSKSLSSHSSAVGPIFTPASLHPPDWLTTVDEIRLIINTLRSNITELDTLHNTLIKPQLNSDRSREEMRVKRLQLEITKLFRAGRARLVHLSPSEVRIRRIQKRRALQGISDSDSDDDLDNIPPDIDEKPATQEDHILLNMQSQLARRLADLTPEFSKSQREYVEHLQRLESGASRIGDQQQYPPQMNQIDAAISAISGTDYASSRDIGFTDGQLSVVNQMEADVRLRTRQIEDIVKSIDELAFIMENISSMVQEQGTLIDQVDQHIQAALDYTHLGLSETRKANASQKAYRKKICILLLIVVVASLGLVYSFI